MLPSKLFKMTTNVSGILLQLEKAGIRLEIGDDFAKYRTYRTRQLDRGPIYPMFDVASSYVDSTNGFWLRIPRVCGHRIHEHVATDSTSMWPPVPRHVATPLR